MKWFRSMLSQNAYKSLCSTTYFSAGLEHKTRDVIYFTQDTGKSSPVSSAEQHLAVFLERFFAAFF